MKWLDKDRNKRYIASIKIRLRKNGYYEYLRGPFTDQVEKALAGRWLNEDPLFICVGTDADRFLCYLIILEEDRLLRVISREFDMLVEVK